MKKLISLIVSGALLTSCASTQSFLGSPQGQAVLATGEGIAKTAITAAASAYGGPLAGSLASAGLDALASVLQGYIGKIAPPAVVKSTPGVAKVGAAVAPLISRTKPVTQADVNLIWTAAQLAKPVASTSNGP